MPNTRIREINPQVEEEIKLVALRMRQTLMEVLGKDKGAALYSMEWLFNRVHWHLDPAQTMAKIFLLENESGEILGQAIARREYDENGKDYGYFSTVFVEPNSRNRGLATGLILQVEAWMREIKMPKVIYNTSANHTKLINLFKRHEYQITHQESEMIQLTKTLLV